LDGHGFDVRTAGSGEEALAMAAEECPHLILLDVEMRGIDGFETIERLHRAEETRDASVIFISARADAKDRLRGLELGAVDYITKPFLPPEVLARVRIHLRIRTLERDLARSNAKLRDRNRALEEQVEERTGDVLRSRDAVIFGLAKLAESRDDETGQHLERICAYVEILVKQLADGDDALDDAWVRTVTTTSALHDIGKVSVPDAVLRKPGKLTDEERRIIERHTTVGGDTLLALKRRWGDDPFLVTAMEIAFGHHERWDGKGYPFGLKGDDIALSARIVSVADVYDALTSPRVYKRALSHDEAKEAIVDGAGSQFDPMIVSAFLRTEDRFREVAAAMRDEPPPDA
jgi:putative two-component system response regulator